MKKEELEQRISQVKQHFLYTVEERNVKALQIEGEVIPLHTPISLDDEQYTDFLLAVMILSNNDVKEAVHLASQHIDVMDYLRKPVKRKEQEEEREEEEEEAVEEPVEEVPSRPYKHNRIAESKKKTVMGEKYQSVPMYEDEINALKQFLKKQWRTVEDMREYLGIRQLTTFAYLEWFRKLGKLQKRGEEGAKKEYHYKTYAGIQ